MAAMADTCRVRIVGVGRMKSSRVGLLVLGILLVGLVQNPAAGQAMGEEEFTDDDFAQFFGLIEGGKITRDKMNARCEKEVVGFTFAGKDLVHEGPARRVDYNETGMTGSVDGRALRSRHFNATFGEWTGAVFKPLCPGMWAIAIDFTIAGNPEQGADDESWAEESRVVLYVRRAGEKRPGRMVLQSAGIAGPASGHLTIALPLHTGDEVATYSEAIGAAPESGTKRALERITFTAFKVGHLEKYVEEFDVDAWNTELEALK
jgi:hypothetical protein